jgi:Fe-S oxidoreductase
LRGLEKVGFQSCCPWYEDATRILSLLGVPRDKVIYISAEDAYETVTEAETVVTACPYCLQMFEDAIKAKEASEKIRSMDIAELVAQAIE